MQKAGKIGKLIKDLPIFEKPNKLYALCAEGAKSQKVGSESFP